MRSIIRNWKTTLCGIALIVVKLFVAKGHVDAETGTAIVGGLGLILANDHDNTGDK